MWLQRVTCGYSVQSNSANARNYVIERMHFKRNRKKQLKGRKVEKRPFILELVFWIIFF